VTTEPELVDTRGRFPMGVHCCLISEAAALGDIAPGSLLGLVQSLSAGGLEPASLVAATDCQVLQLSRGYLRESGEGVQEAPRGARAHTLGARLHAGVTDALDEAFLAASAVTALARQGIIIPPSIVSYLKGFDRSKGSASRVARALLGQRRSVLMQLLPLPDKVAETVLRKVLMRMELGTGTGSKTPES
jgi:hypothetical protein